MIAVCVVCGNIFEKKGIAKTCSPDCSKERCRKKYVHELELEKLRIRMLKKYASEKDVSIINPKPLIYYCQVCGNQINSKRKRTITCSEKCSLLRKRQLNRIFNSAYYQTPENRYRNKEMAKERMRKRAADKRASEALAVLFSI